ncbi:hypothetical protein LINPERHAP1_LOCUS33829 [Linum perenne]
MMMVAVEEATTAEGAIGLQPPVKLTWHYYRLHTSCKYAEEYVKHQLLRLLYSDCFVTVSNSIFISLINIFFSSYFEARFVKKTGKTWFDSK